MTLTFSKAAIKHKTINNIGDSKEYSSTINRLKLQTILELSNLSIHSRTSFSLFKFLKILIASLYVNPKVVIKNLQVVKVLTLATFTVEIAFNKILVLATITRLTSSTHKEIQSIKNDLPVPLGASIMISLGFSISPEIPKEQLKSSIIEKIIFLCAAFNNCKTK
ncbi:hypothetical protein MrNuV_ORF088 [Macrobrachium rosenbergii nudivirus]|nr:hypothetical protein MrNuV_ORF088 [Macrobrachium rosenbergii nudivirus]